MTRPTSRPPVAAAAVIAALLLAAPLAVPATGESGSALSARRPATSWTADLAAGDACATVTDACHVQLLAVSARRGSLVTVQVEQEGWALDVVGPDGATVARDGATVSYPVHGPHEQTETDDDVAADVTFEVPGPGRYRVRVTGELGRLAGEPPRVPVSAQLGGVGLDRDPDCDQPVVVPVVPGVSTPPGDTGQRLAAHVRVVVPPDLVADVRAAAPVAVSAYDGIGVDLRLSYDITPLPAGVSDPSLLRGFARARYGGRRPAGVDAVFVANDVFGGGQADCLAGVLHPEQGFSIGQVHYSPENALPGGTGTVSAGVVLAHEVGHTFGGHHEQGNCAEAAPPQAGYGTSAESRGPCTIMSPAALTIGRSFGTLEGATIRSVLLRRP